MEMVMLFLPAAQWGNPLSEEWVIVIYVTWGYACHFFRSCSSLSLVNLSFCDLLTTICGTTYVFLVYNDHFFLISS